MNIIGSKLCLYNPLERECSRERDQKEVIEFMGRAQKKNS